MSKPSPAAGAVAGMLEGMHGILTFIVGIASMLLHLWTCVIIYQTWGFKLAFPAFILPVVAELGVLISEWQRRHEWLTHYGMCVAVVALGFVVASLIGMLAAQARGNAPAE